MHHVVDKPLLGNHTYILVAIMVAVVVVVVVVMWDGVGPNGGQNWGLDWGRWLDLGHIGFRK